MKALESLPLPSHRPNAVVARRELARKMLSYYQATAVYHANVAALAGSRPSEEELALFSAIARERQDRQNGATRVLELGCGRCESAPKLLAMLGGGEYHGIDASAEAVTFGARANPAFHIQVGDISQLPYGDESFDVVVLNYVLEHTCEPDRVLDEALRVLRCRGTIGMIVPVTDVPWITPPSLRHRVHDPLFIVRHTCERWTHFLKLRYLPNYFAFPLVYDPIVLADPSSTFVSDDDLVYLGSSLEISKYLRTKGCEIVAQLNRDISSTICNGRRPWVDAARTAVFFVLRCSLVQLDSSRYTSTVSLVARKL